MSIKNTRIVLCAVVLIVVIVYFYSSLRRVSEPPSINLREETACLTALCVLDETYGDNCLEFSAKVAHIVYDDQLMRMSVQLKADCEVR